MYLVFDLETVGADFNSFDESQQEYLLRNAATDEERTRKIDELALSPLTGKIVCIGMSLVTKGADNEWQTRNAAYTLDESMSDTDNVVESALASGPKCFRSSERLMIQNFWKLLTANPGVHLITFNGRNFDAPWLMLRSALLGIRPQRNLMDGTRFNYSGHTDLLDKLTFYSGASTGPLRKFNFDFYAKAFGITSPKSAGVDGSKVQTLFASGELDTIAEYCLRDVKATWELFLKWSAVLK